MVVVMVLNNLGGTIGDRLVKHSLTELATIKAKPTTRRVIVSAESPIDMNLVRKVKSQ